jgi:hypothetical protein
MIEILAILAMTIVATGTAMFYILLFLWIIKNFRGK